MGVDYFYCECCSQCVADCDAWVREIDIIKGDSVHRDVKACSYCIDKFDNHKDKFIVTRHKEEEHDEAYGDYFDTITVEVKANHKIVIYRIVETVV